MGRPPASVHRGLEKLLGLTPSTGDQITMSNNNTKMKLADQIRKHAKAHPKDQGAQEIVSRLDAMQASILKE